MVNKVMAVSLCLILVFELSAGITFSCSKKQDEITVQNEIIAKAAGMSLEARKRYRAYLLSKGAQETAKLFTRPQDLRHLSPHARRRNQQKVHAVDAAITQLTPELATARTVGSPSTQPQLPVERLSSSESKKMEDFLVGS